MSELEYHVETEIRNAKYAFALRLGRKETVEALKKGGSSVSEREALQRLLKGHVRRSPSLSVVERFVCSSEESFDVLKLLGSTGRLFYQEKKVMVDPFSSLELFVKLKKLSADRAAVEPRWRLRGQSGSVRLCQCVFPADPSWAFDGGVLRPFETSVSSRWVRWALSVKAELEGKDLFDFIEEAQGEIPYEWEGEPLSCLEPTPLLCLADRHGAFAHLYFDYGAWGKYAAHEAFSGAFRNKASECQIEKDLLETDFIKKVVDRTHYYCPLDRVAKSLSFLLEVGWTILDAKGRKVIRQGRGEWSALVDQDDIVVQAQISYAQYQLDLKDLVGAFNRRERFVELDSQAVALIDRERGGQEWEDLLEEEVVAEGVRLKKNRVGLLETLLQEKTMTASEGVRHKVMTLLQGRTERPVEVGEGFRGVLFAYQQRGLEWLQFLHEGGLGGVLADEMGLGKTVQVLAFFSQLPSPRPSLIVVPTSLLFNWQREFERFLPSLSCYRHEGKGRLDKPQQLAQHSIILTSYAILRQDAALFQEGAFQVLILDEAQVIKNPDSQIARVCASLHARTRIAITGTPIENRLEDLWSLFHVLQPDLLGERARFRADLLSAQANPRLLERMRKKLRPFLLRRKKEEVSLQLPPKLEQTVFVEMTDLQRALYEECLQKTRQGLLKKVSVDGAQKHRVEILEAILRLRQLCVYPPLVESESQETGAKFERVFSDLDEVVSEGRKVLVYSQFTSALAQMAKEAERRGWAFAYLDGSTRDREEVVRRFQEEASLAIFFISLKAGGVGLNLTAADYVFLYDPWWNEAVERQAIDRAHRVGREGAVIARRYLTALSIEEKIQRLKAHKVALSDALLEGEATESMPSLEELLELFD